MYERQYALLRPTTLSPRSDDFKTFSHVQRAFSRNVTDRLHKRGDHFSAFLCEELPHPDYLNTPREVYDDQAQLRWRWDQAEPFGVTPPDENPVNLGAFELPLRFPGQYADKETNNNYNYFRDYASSIGRYVQSDPIGMAGGLNTYSYVSARPLKLRDTRGLAAPLAVGVAVRVIGGRAAASAILSGLQSSFGPTGGLVAACLIAGICSSSEEEEKKPSNVVPFPGKKQEPTTAPCPPDGPCDEWLKGLQDMYFDVTMGYSNPLDELSRREFNNSVKRFKNICPHLADQIDEL